MKKRDVALLTAVAGMPMSLVKLTVWGQLGRRGAEGLTAALPMFDRSRPFMR